MVRQTALAPLQKWLHKTVSSNPMFELIGKPCTEEYITERLGKRPLASDESFISGDYSAATDNIKSYLSRRVAWKLYEMGKIGLETYTLFEAALTEHYLTDPLDPKRLVAQAKGQLMGSIVSFPVLCILNGALVRFLQEVMFRRTFLFANCMAMINGDDNLWRARFIRSSKRNLNRSAMSLFEEVAKAFGFTLSVGKTYDSREVAVINSEMYRARTMTYKGRQVLYYTKVKYTATSIFTDLGRSGAPPSWKKSEKPCASFSTYQKSMLKVVEDPRYRDLWRVGHQRKLQTRLAARFPNIYAPPKPTEALKPKLIQELLYGTHRYGDWSIGRRLRGVLEEVPENRRAEFYRYFIRHNISLLKLAETPWFMPETLGGLGLPIMSEGGSFHAPGQPVAFGPSDQNRQVLMKVLDAVQNGKGPKSVQNPTPWKVHQRVMNMLPRRNLPLPADTSDEVLDRFKSFESSVYGALVFSTYLRLSPQDLHDEAGKHNRNSVSVRAIKHNARLWDIRRYKALAPLRVCPDVWEIHERLRTLYVAPVLTSAAQREAQGPREILQSPRAPIGDDESGFQRYPLHIEVQDDVQFTIPSELRRLPIAEQRLRWARHHEPEMTVLANVV
jgi:hypothetical protein